MNHEKPFECCRLRTDTRNSAVPYATGVFAVAQNFVVQQTLTNFLKEFNIGIITNLIVQPMNYPFYGRLLLCRLISLIYAC